jgi:hypothetical protein
VTASTAGQASLFGPAAQADMPRPAPPLGMRPAAARLVTTGSPDRLDRDGRPLVLIVVDPCPYCDAAHVHPGGHQGAPRLCPRRARCAGRPAGAYYFPAVQL